MHLGLEGASELLLGDERMSASLLWRPSLQWVDVQETMDEINEGDSVVHF
jgi:hypothetical protein